MQRKERVGFAQAHGEAAGTTQFDFLLPWNEHHAFYCWARDEEARRRAKEELCGVEAELLRDAARLELRRADTDSAAL